MYTNMLLYVNIIFILYIYADNIKWDTENLTATVKLK